MNFPSFVYNQLVTKLPYPTKDFSGQTVIVTGANVGLGLEAARHFVRLGAEKVILGVRTISKGEAAQKSIEASTGRLGVLEVWQLDLSKYESVKRFAKKAEGLKRLDAVVENAGIVTIQYEVFEDNESTITVNVISTMLLALLILPKLRETARDHHVVPRLTIVTSEVHALAKFPEREKDNIFDTVNEKATAIMSDRYNLSKLLEVFAVRELASKTSQSEPEVAINMLNPGFCHSELLRNATGMQGMVMAGMKALLARTTEEGSRTLVHAAGVGMETHGKYLSDCQEKDFAVAKMVRGHEGANTQKKVWAQLCQKLEGIQPGILENI
ncbi:MAG: hypothetical protein M1830_003439 [Pleopsidium flavum]|nr:MAG: hypothetical protein M1830_003439 [Pleopsidium flavum]